MLEHIFVTSKINEKFGSVGNNSSSHWRISLSIKISFSQCQGPSTEYLKIPELKSLPVRTQGRVCIHLIPTHILRKLYAEPECQQKPKLTLLFLRCIYGIIRYYYRSSQGMGNRLGEKCCCCCWCYGLFAKSCLTLCYPMDSSLEGFSVHGISQARILEWVAISFSRESSQPRDQTWVSSTGRLIFYHWASRKAQEKCSWQYLIQNEAHLSWPARSLRTH